MSVAAVAAIAVTAVLVTAVAVFLVVVVALLVRIGGVLGDIVAAVTQVGERTEPLEAVLGPIEADLVAAADALGGAIGGGAGQTPA